MQSSHSLPRNPLAKLIAQRLRAAKERLAKELFVHKTDLSVFAAKLGPLPSDPAAAPNLDYEEVAAGDVFGPPGGGWMQRWFKLAISKAEPHEVGRRVLFWECQGETTVYIDGRPWAGLDVAHDYCPLPDGECTLYLDTGTYQTGIWANKPGISKHTGCVFEAASIRLRNKEAWDVYHDFAVLVDLLLLELSDRDFDPPRGPGFTEPLPPLPARVRRLLYDLDKVVDWLDRREYGAAGTLLKRIYEKNNGRSGDGKAGLLGHAHIDLVWLWPEVVTYHKGVHTFANTLRLLDAYPEFVFNQSSPFLYKKLEAISPQLMEEVRRQIAKGRWEVTGGFTVEADVTVPTGEALARSLLFGQQAFYELQGRHSRLVWIPDVFGYSASLPKIMRQGGIEFFYTTKMTWSAVTRFPYTTFNWRGDDGSEVLTHLCSIGYNGSVNLSEIRLAVERNYQSHLAEETLLPTGYGDGGGGVTEEMLERARRITSLAGVPESRWVAAEAFFDGLADPEEPYPIYEGELYLEYHRAVTTTQSETKRLNRKAEKALFAWEAMRTLTGGAPLTAEQWDRVLLTHFHDAIPGSSIGLVYEELETDLRKTIEAAHEAVLAEAPRGDEAALFNPLPVSVTKVVDTYGNGALAAALKEAGFEGQSVVAPDGNSAQVFLLTAAPGSVATTASGLISKTAARPVETGRFSLQNGIVDVRFDKDGNLEFLSVYDTDLGVTRAGLVTFADQPAKFDAWDVDRGTLALGTDAGPADEVVVAEEGPLRGIIQTTHKVGKASFVKTRYILEAGSDMLDIELEVDWRETHVLLKHHFATRHHQGQARFGTPFGSVVRSRVRGHEDVEAQWEMSAQRWLALTDAGGQDGIAWITEAKYGVSCHDGNVGLSLLRASTEPDEQADRGRHTIRYAVGRYQSRTGEIGPSTALAAETRYSPLFALENASAARGPVEVVAADSLVPTSPKPSEGGTGFVMRLWEASGLSGTATLAPADGILVYESDILESKGRQLRVDDNGLLRLKYAPYELISLLFERS